VRAQDLMTSLQGVSVPDVPPAALQYAPVCSAEVCVAQCVADRVDGAVDVAQPITYIDTASVSLYVEEKYTASKEESGRLHSPLMTIA